MFKKIKSLFSPSVAKRSSTKYSIDYLFDVIDYYLFFQFLSFKTISRISTIIVLFALVVVLLVVSGNSHLLGLSR